MNEAAILREVADRQAIKALICTYCRPVTPQGRILRGTRAPTDPSHAILKG